MKNIPRRFIAACAHCTAAVLALCAFVFTATAGTVQSFGTMTFVDANTLVVADWSAGKLHALQLPPTAAVTPSPFNLMNISGPIARALHKSIDQLRFEDMSFRPGTELAYISLSIAVRAPNGQRVAGCAAVKDGETVWRFAPAQSWGAGADAIVVHGDLEDPAGSRIGALFETAMASRGREEVITNLAFTPRPGPNQRIR